MSESVDFVKILYGEMKVNVKLAFYFSITMVFPHTSHYWPILKFSDRFELELV